METLVETATLTVKVFLVSPQLWALKSACEVQVAKFKS